MCAILLEVRTDMRNRMKSNAGLGLKNSFDRLVVMRHIMNTPMVCSLFLVLERPGIS